MMPGTKRVSLLIPDKLYDRIEKRRGLIKRSTYIVDVLERALGKE